MIWIDWAIIGFLAWGGVTGYVRGFLPTLFRLLSSVGGLFIALVYTTPVVRMLDRGYGVTSSIAEFLRERMPIQSGSSLTRSLDWTSVTDSLSIPEPYGRVLSRYAHEVVSPDGSFVNHGGPILHYLAFLIVNALVFIGLFVAAGMAIAVICRTLRLLSFGGLVLPGNHILGAVVGLGRNALSMTLYLGIATLLLAIPMVNSVLGEAMATSRLAPYFLRLFMSIAFWILDPARLLPQ